MAWGDLFREDFTGAAGASASSWVPTTDVVDKQWLVGVDSTSSDPARGQLDGAGNLAVGASGPAFIVLVPEIMESVTGSVASPPMVWKPYSTAPKKVAAEAQFTVPALTSAITGPGYGFYAACSINLRFADPAVGMSTNGDGSVSNVVGLYFQEWIEVDVGATTFYGNTGCEVYNTANSQSTDGGITVPTYGAGPFTIALRIEWDGTTLKTYRNGALQHNFAPSVGSRPPSTYRLTTVEFTPEYSVHADANYDPLPVAAPVKVNYVLVQADTVELAAFTPGGGGSSVTAAGASLTSTATLTAGAVNAAAVVSGTDLTASATFTAGEVSIINPGSTIVSGVTLEATASVVGGSASGLPFDATGTPILFDVFSGVIDTIPSFAQGGMTWGADGNMPAGANTATFFDHGATSLKRAMLYAGRGTWDFRYSPSAAISGFSQTVPANGLQTDSVIASVAVTPWLPYNLRSDLSQHGFAQMLFMLESPAGMQWVRVALGADSELDAGLNSGEATVSMSSALFGYPPPLVEVPYTFTAQQRLVFQARVSGSVVSLYINGVLLGGARLEHPVSFVHAVGVEVTSYNDIHVFALEDVAAPPLMWRDVRGLYECA